jgi:hypothetical protein
MRRKVRRRDIRDVRSARVYAIDDVLCDIESENTLALRCHLDAEWQADIPEADNTTHRLARVDARKQRVQRLRPACHRIIDSTRERWPDRGPLPAEALACRGFSGTPRRDLLMPLL